MAVNLCHCHIRRTFSLAPLWKGFLNALVRSPEYKKEKIPAQAIPISYFFTEYFLVTYINYFISPAVRSQSTFVAPFSEWDKHFPTYVVKKISDDGMLILV